MHERGADTTGKRFVYFGFILKPRVLAFTDSKLMATSSPDMMLMPRCHLRRKSRMWLRVEIYTTYRKSRVLSFSRVDIFLRHRDPVYEMLYLPWVLGLVAPPRINQHTCSNDACVHDPSVPRRNWWGCSARSGAREGLGEWEPDPRVRPEPRGACRRTSRRVDTVGRSEDVAVLTRWRATMRTQSRESTGDTDAVTSHDFTWLEGGAGSAQATTLFVRVVLPISLEGLIRLKGTAAEAWEQQPWQRYKFLWQYTPRVMHGRMLVLHISHNARVYSGTNAMHYDNFYCMTMK